MRKSILYSILLMVIVHFYSCGKNKFKVDTYKTSGKFTHGTMSISHYSNDFFGIKIPLSNVVSNMLKADQNGWFVYVDTATVKSEVGAILVPISNTTTTNIPLLMQLEKKPSSVVNLEYAYFPTLPVKSMKGLLDAYTNDYKSIVNQKGKIEFKNGDIGNRRMVLMEVTTETEIIRHYIAKYDKEYLLEINTVCAPNDLPEIEKILSKIEWVD